MRKAINWGPESGNWRKGLRAFRAVLGVEALREMLAEQNGRVSRGAEVEGLKLKLSNTVTAL